MNRNAFASSTRETTRVSCTSLPLIGVLADLVVSVVLGFGFCGWSAPGSVHELTEQLIRRGDHRSVCALKADICAWVKNWNADPTSGPITAQDILESLGRLINRIDGAGR